MASDMNSRRSNYAERYGGWALITGGSSGIGLALARQLAAGGMNLLLVARDQAKLDAVADELRRAHQVEVACICADLSRPEGLDSMFAATHEHEVGILVPCAAIESHGYFVDDSAAVQQAMLQMDVVAPTLMAHHYGAKMAARGRGAILLVSSLSGWMAQPYMAAYGAAKAHLRSLGGSLHFELGDRGVDVTVLSPGPTNTPMAAGTGIDFASMGMAVMQPDRVAALGLAGLGKRADVVPGIRNRMMLFMITRVMPQALAGWMFKKMLGKALGIHVTALPSGA